MKIRLLEKEDLAAILAIQEKTPQAARWLDADYLRLADDPGGMIVVAELETMTPPKVLGFAAFHRVIDEAELRNMAIDPDHRHRGVGRALMETACNRLRQAGTKRVYLEVRASNKQAQAFYVSVGFGLHSRRTEYYRDPPEDAYIMCLQLFPPAVVPAMP